MNYSKIIVNRLLDKYEKSLHAKGEGLSNRRVLLKTGKTDLPEYDYHNDNLRDAFNQEIFNLENAGIVMKAWGRKGYVLSEIWLNLDHINAAYQLVGRETQKCICSKYIFLLAQLKKDCKTAWIREFAKYQIDEIQNKGTLTTLCKRDYAEFQDLISSLRGYDLLHGESVTMRTFSIQCYHDSKYFEKYVKDYFLSIAKKYCPTLIDAEEDSDISWREQLMIMGIFARPEIYALSGNIKINFHSGVADLSVFGSAGIALPDILVDSIIGIDMGRIKQIMFIENKTCYDEYILRLKRHNELVFYQGGFISPQKVKFINKLKQFAAAGTRFYFWGDIDIGGIKMFHQLRECLADILPWKMDANEFVKYSGTGMERPDNYFLKMEHLLKDQHFPMFHDVIKKALQYRVTIEQESMLDAFVID